MNYDLVVIGGGPAGLAAAIEAKKKGINSILIIDRDKELGGILNQCIHNGFGLHIFNEELTGPEYADRFIKELEALNIEFKLDTMVITLEEDKSIIAINPEDGLMNIKSRAVILAMGCRERTRGAIHIPGTRPAGVFTAGTAQRFVNIEGYMVGKEVVILGSGDIGLIMARRMTLEGAVVKAVVELLPYSGGLKRNIVQCLDDFNIPLLLSHTVIDIKGKDRVEGVTIAKVDEKRRTIEGTEKFIPCDTLLLSVGLIPENELSKMVNLDLDNSTGGPVVNESMETSIGGIFACGNVVHVHDLVDWVTEESKRAGKGAVKYLKNQLMLQKDTVKTYAGYGIKYIVPQIIRPSNIEKDLEVFMRVTDVFKNRELVIKIDNKEFKRIKKSHLAPGEMESANINVEDIKGAAEISIEVQ
ncbi:NAD(P)/FAD-dependent oxidoreductase [Tissierella sp. MSJ-40]|uniref:NAD(P)/FAD-dependent oxidoreductase n=1 Tax=Tissierella simiarum TaxID=2841534 RepID=A0ABS6E8L0_9FIRM|nr:NAD(P)/FAD-dependent oxidoreductase [Tissierella simiarum]MBU5439267.1 NAD(P)/FAD-dependent oxidoreductase [Tissierella simiarum]